jgi:oligosaccharide repeat unit polymerase
MIDTLLLVTLLLSATAILAAWRINGLLMSGVVVFWAAWSTLVASAWVAVRFELLPEVPDSTFEYVYPAYYGAFAGSIVGILAAGRAKRLITDTPAWRRLAWVAEWCLEKFLVPVVVVCVITGLVHFVQRWALIDFDLFRIYELRLITRQLTWTWGARVASYASLVGMFMLVLLGVADAEYGVRSKRLMLAWLSTVPHGMAFAGRGWTLAPLIFYAFSYLVSRQCSARPRSWRALAPVGALALLGLWFFVVLGSVRNRQMTSDEMAQLGVSQWDDGQKYMMASWIGSSLGAIGVQGDFVAELKPTWGAVTFDWITRKAAESGFAYSSSFDKWEYWRINILPRVSSGGSTWCVPPTAIPSLILDFGTAGMPIALAVMVALLHWFSVRWVGQGLLRNTVAFLSVNSLFSSIQMLNLFTSVTVIVLVTAGIATLFLPREEAAPDDSEPPGNPGSALTAQLEGRADVH